MLYALVLILVSILISPAFFVSKKPEIQKYIDKVTPIQGWIGVLSVAWGVWQMFRCLLNYKEFADERTWWFSWLVGTILIVINGFLLGYAKLKKHFLSRNPETKEKAEILRQRLKPLEKLLGIIGVLFGIWMIFAYIF